MASRTEMMHQVKHAYYKRLTVGEEGRIVAELVALVCELIDIRALTEWTAALQRDPQAPLPDSALTVARRG